MVALSDTGTCLFKIQEFSSSTDRVKSAMHPYIRPSEPSRLKLLNDEGRSNMLLIIRVDGCDVGAENEVCLSLLQIWQINSECCGP